MRNHRMLMCVTVLTFVCLTTIASVQSSKSASNSAQSSIWRSDFAKAWEDAQRLHQPMLVHFYAHWCGPCRQMERTVLNSPEVLKGLEANFIAVKVNSDEHQELVEHFNVRALPCDIFVHPDGHVISQTEGFQARSRYHSKVAQIGAQFEHSVTIRNAKGNRSKGQAIAKNGESEPSVLRPKKRNDESAHNTNSQRSPSPVHMGKTRSLVGLNGYSPVSLGSSRKWIKGKKEFSHTYQDVVFYLANAEELREFQEDAGRFAPQLLGCDPVVLWNSDRAVLGNTQYGAYFDNELYLFDSAQSRQRFKDNPLRYTRTRHVLRVDRIDVTRLR